MIKEPIKIYENLSDLFKIIIKISENRFYQQSHQIHFMLQMPHIFRPSLPKIIHSLIPIFYFCPSFTLINKYLIILLPKNWIKPIKSDIRSLFWVYQNWKEIYYLWWSINKLHIVKKQHTEKTRAYWYHERPNMNSIYW